MQPVDVIARKRDGHALTRAEIDAFVRGVTDGTFTDCQASALLMATVLRGMTADETAWLTDAMTRSGTRVDLSDLPGTPVGKHSTGGVGDKVSIVLAPLAAACGVYVPKLSGRGLGHTGGTLDKLESIPGCRVNLGVEEFVAVLREIGTSIASATADMAPADRTLYALRDVTGTIESVPLIAASIMSKKLAEGSRALVLDVKSGDGAFLRTQPQAATLAAALVDVGRRAGLPTEAVVTDMDTPLGHAVGNALEVAESVAALRGQGPDDLVEVVLALGARMVRLAGLEEDDVVASARVLAALESGRGLDRFIRLVERQGGDPRVVDEPGRLPSAPGRACVRAPRSGHLSGIRAGAIGRAAHALGAGRSRAGDLVDPGVGVLVRARAGDEVREGDPLIEIHHRDGRGLEAAVSLCEAALAIEDEPVRPRSRILQVLS
jgi:pyrimidine-nucleoside phosphorylase